MDRNTRTLLMCVGIVTVMVGASFAAVPFYDWFCRMTGFDGTPLRADQVPDESGIYDRTIRIRFDANVAPGLAWDFKPGEAHQDIRVGDTGITFYSAKNTGKRPTMGHATFNVTPEKAGKYFVKVSCFCFTDQPLGVGETREMPVNFFVDPSIMTDPRADDITEITLSYTFFPQANEQAAADMAAPAPATAQN